MGIIGFFQEFIKLMDPMLILVMLGSTVLGVVIGALPGLTATMGIALLTGLTYKVPTVFTFTILIGVYVGAIYGGSISAILLNIPGTASAAATALDGHQLALQGKAVSAIRITRSASIVGTLIGVLALALLAPPLTKVALMFTSPEYFMLALFGVMICGTIVSSDLAIKGWIGGLLGLIISFVGMDKLHGVSRFDFGIIDLMSGVSIIPAMIGFYAMPEVIKAFVRNTRFSVNQSTDAEPKVSVFKVLKSNIRVIIQSALIGLGVGALPGVGEDVAAWVAYDTARKTSKKKHLYGTGLYEGAIAPEVGNNSAIGGALIPLLTLAVPGSPPAAVLLGALMLHNIRPGPMILRENPTFINHFAALLLLAVIALWVAGMVLSKPMAKILKVPVVYLMPIVSALSFIGAYAINNRSFDLIIVFLFGVLGYFLDKMKYSPAPIVLGLILGNMIDENFRRTLIVSSGDPMLFLSRPISLLFFLVIVYTILRQVFSKKKTAGAAMAEVEESGNQETDQGGGPKDA